MLVKKETCENEQLVGDLCCDDGNNHENCHYDGGDCCLSIDIGEYWLSLSTDNCSECLCHTAGNITNKF